MRVAVMQPYFVPYVGYFELIANVDLFVFLENVQFARRGWVHRNRIRDGRLAQGWRYITAPLHKAPFTAQISELRLRKDAAWQAETIRLLHDVYGNGVSSDPLFRWITGLASAEGAMFSDELCGMLAALAGRLGLPTRFARDTAFTDWTQPLDRQERLISIALTAGATHYVNLPGGRDLYDPVSFRERGLALEFLEQTTFVVPSPAEVSLSVLDALFSRQEDALARHLADIRRAMHDA